MGFRLNPSGIACSSMKTNGNETILALHVSYYDRKQCRAPGRGQSLHLACQGLPVSSAAWTRTELH